MFNATVYGLRIASDEPIPGLSPHRFSGAPDLTVRFGAAPDWPATSTTIRYVHPEKDDAGMPLLSCADLGARRLRLDYTGGARFFLDLAASTCWVTWPEAMTRELVSAYLLGPVLGFFLRNRGLVCLHASVLRIGPRCVAFVGISGAGKSTLAAALAQKGAEVVTEDVACLSEGDDGFWIQPGYPLLRLWEESVPMLGLASEALQAVGWKKRCLSLDAGPYRFHANAVRLTDIFILGGRRFMEPPARMRELGGREILESLVANTFVTYLLDRQMRASEFETLGRLARTVRIRELTLVDDGARLLEARDWLLRELQA
jgi:hypothetical protein